MKWQAIAPGGFFEDGDEFVVFFSQGSGSTHLINPVAAFVLDLLIAGPRSTEELLQHMASQVEDVPAEEMQAVLANLLEELQHSELIEAG